MKVFNYGRILIVDGVLTIALEIILILLQRANVKCDHHEREYSSEYPNFSITYLDGGRLYD